MAFIWLATVNYTTNSKGCSLPNYQTDLPGGEVGQHQRGVLAWIIQTPFTCFQISHNQTCKCSYTMEGER